MKNYKISVIVPIYNTAKWLNRCVDSIINQTYKNLEIILINDGSSDDSLDIINQYKLSDNRIVVINQGNSGLVKSREVGINIATGDYIGFVDSDDYINPNMYERLLNNAIKYNADISHCATTYFYDKPIAHSLNDTNLLLEMNNFQGLVELLKGEIFEPSLCNKLYAAHLLSNSCIDQTIVNNEDLLRNYILFKRANKSVFDNFCGYYYFQRDDSMSKNSQKIKICKNMYNAKKIIVDISDDEIKPYAIQLMLKSIIASLNILSTLDNKEAKDFCKFCRKVLINKIKHIKFLKKTQQISVLLYIISPTIYKTIYSVLKKMRNT